ncbi:unnamed protein product [Menidia menidia]|uniref:(Atlantic silverside) hypothetical protein n=1 Tax=Menidia menidia TaxID=238744 RepID=A0A8S4BXV5_9TELE|nr:unnamed protein product [Menidia menidia]
MAEVGEGSGPREEGTGTGSAGPGSPGNGSPGNGSPGNGRSRKLVLHVDLNNTILVSDAVTGHGTVAALDYFLTTVTWGKMSKQGVWEWLSDAPSLLPPRSDAVSYYSQFGRVKAFTSVAGRPFRGVLDQHLELLLWPEGTKASKALLIILGIDSQRWFMLQASSQALFGSELDPEGPPPLTPEAPADLFAHAADCAAPSYSNMEEVD